MASESLALEQSMAWAFVFDYFRLPWFIDRSNGDNGAVLPANQFLAAGVGEGATAGEIRFGRSAGRPEQMAVVRGHGLAYARTS
jgi:hypothetical protein